MGKEMCRSVMRKFVYTTLALMLSLQTAVGGTWMKNKTKSGASFGKVCALVDRGGSGYCLVQENGPISWSDDGSSWATGLGFAQGTLRCADFFDNNNGVAAGLNLLEYTKDGGKNWTVIQGNTVPFDVRGVCMTSPNTVVLVGSGGNIAEYTFGQSSVTAKTSGTRNTLNSVSFYGGTGYACGDDGTILKYEDGAWTYLTSENEKNWVSYTDPTEAGRTVRLNEIRAVDARTVYACGDEGVLLKTVDGGTTWSRRESGTTQNLTAMTIKPDGNLSINGGGKQLTVDDQTDKYSSKMYYDRLGRVVASQNSKQHAMRPQRFSYTVYDALGRNVEAGELESDAEPTEAMINATDTRFPDNWSHKRYQVIRSVYDEPIYDESADDSVRQAFGEGGQQHLRNRIATTLYQEVYNPSSRVYNHATHYSYDIHGNVSTLVHDIRELGKVGQRFKRIDYDYDLVSGKVNQLDYQKGQPDGYSLRYEYDGENRLTRVLANYQGDESWHELARYEYYRHGPLARTVLGTNLQGVDYAYTLQGWTKGVNLSQESDTVKADVYGYELQYNNEDYKPIGIANHPQVDDGAANLYNGNIAAMRTTLTQNVPANEGNLFGAQTRRFVYDELNRLKASQVVGSDQYQTSYTYDANGNITSLTRNNQSGTAMDNLTYHYAMDKAGNILNNRLLHVNDAVNTTDGTDIKDQGGNYTQQRASTHNYDYDEIGNLIKDKSEQIAEIRWTVTGKVSDVIRTAGSQKPDLHFDYDAMGQRIAKTVTNKNTTDGTDKFVTTYYVRDPQGNVLAVYEHKHGESDNGTFTLAEQHLYGAGRLGMKKRDLALNVANASEPTPVTHYELTNHLGNVMAVISDKASDTNEPTVVSLSDYYPFGMTEPGRSWNAGDYRFGYTGHEKENDLAEGVYTTEYRLLDTRLGRWMSVDKLAGEFAGMSPYNYCAGNPVVMVDSDGKRFIFATEADKERFMHNIYMINDKSLLCDYEQLENSPIDYYIDYSMERDNEFGVTWNPYGDKRIETTIYENTQLNLKDQQDIPCDEIVLPFIRFSVREEGMTLKSGHYSAIVPFFHELRHAALFDAMTRYYDLKEDIASEYLDLINDALTKYKEANPDNYDFDIPNQEFSAAQVFFIYFSHGDTGPTEKQAIEQETKVAIDQFELNEGEVTRDTYLDGN